MPDNIVISDIRERIMKKTIHELRQIARLVGVAHPADGKKERLVEDITNIMTCRLEPAPRTSRGAPPKACEYDKGLVADIEACREYYLAEKLGTGIVGERYACVSDGQSGTDCRGILKKCDKRYFLRVEGCSPSRNDVFVHDSFVNRFDLREGDEIVGLAMSRNPSEAPGLVAVTSVNGFSPDGIKRKNFGELTAVYPSERLKISTAGSGAFGKMCDLLVPLAMGQRIVFSLPRTIKSKDFIGLLSEAVAANCPSAKTVVFTIAARPEDITLLKRVVSDGYFCTSFADSDGEHVSACEFVAEYLKRRSECGLGTVLIVEGLASLFRACREEGDRSGYKKLFSLARCAEEGGSLTVMALVRRGEGVESEVLSELSAAANAVITVDNAGNLNVSESYSLDSGLWSPDEESAARNITSAVENGTPESEIAKVFSSAASVGEIVERYK